MRSCPCAPERILSLSHILSSSPPLCTSSDSNTSTPKARSPLGRASAAQHNKALLVVYGARQG